MAFQTAESLDIEVFDAVATVFVFCLSNLARVCLAPVFAVEGNRMVLLGVFDVQSMLCLHLQSTLNNLALLLSNAPCSFFNMSLAPPHDGLKGLR